MKSFKHILGKTREYYVIGNGLEKTVDMKIYNSLELAYYSNRFPLAAALWCVEGLIGCFKLGLLSAIEVENAVGELSKGCRSSKFQLLRRYEGLLR